LEIVSGRLLWHLMPLKVSAIEPHPVKDNAEFPRHRDAGALDPTAFGDLESPLF
jgi:hypothetical protein